MRTGWAIAIGAVLLLVGGLIGSLYAPMQDANPSHSMPLVEVERESGLEAALRASGSEPLAVAAYDYRFGGEVFTFGHVSVLTERRPMEQSAVLDAAQQFTGSFRKIGFPEDVMIVVHFYAHEPKTTRPPMGAAIAGGWSDQHRDPGEDEDTIREWRASVQSRVNLDRPVDWYACVILTRLIEWSAPGGREHAEPQQGQSRLGDWQYSVYWCDGNRAAGRPEGKQYPKLVMSSFEADPRGTR